MSANERLTAVATSLTLFDKSNIKQSLINSSVRSMCRLHEKLVFDSSAAHCVATANVTGKRKKNDKTT